MTQTITKNIVAVAFIVALFSILLAMPQASEAREIRAERSSMSEMMKDRKASTTSERGDMGKKLKEKMTASSTSSSTRPTINLSCVQTAVAERETAVSASWGEFNTSITVALTARKDALVSAWQLTDAKARAEALKSLWKNWKDASKGAHEALKTDRKATRDEFKQTMKDECKVTNLPKEDEEMKDAAGAVNL